jgi:hypothetical protein
MYRDAVNYKNFGFAIFKNPNSLSILELNKKLARVMIDELYFDHTKLRLPPLFFENLNSDDHAWHEYISIELTDKDQTEDVTIDIAIFHAENSTN